jgi:hypothetical protein
MGDAPGFSGNGPIDEVRRGPGPSQPQPRAVGSPLPIGSGTATVQSSSLNETQRTISAPPPGRALANTVANNEPFEVPSGVQRTVSAIRAALPWIQRILPLLDGNIGTAVSNFIVPRHHAPTPPPAPPVNLAPIEEGLAELQSQQRELRDQVVEQNTSLKRVEDQLEMVREATDRNTLEQQELMEDLKVVGNKVNMFSLVALGLLAISVIINVVLYLHIVRVLP